MEMARGEENGIKYKVELVGEMWVATVEKNGRVEKEEWRHASQPTCGPDVVDVNIANKILSKLINKFDE